MSRRKSPLTLTDREKIFCEEYIQDLDATKAAIRAGYSESSAKTTAHHVKQKPAVEAYISQLMEKRQLRLRITADEILLELAKIGFAEPVNFNEEDAAEEPANIPQSASTGAETDQTETEITHTVSPVTAKYSASTMFRVVDTDAETGRRTIRYFSLQAKIAALKLLGRHLGLFGATGKGLPKRPNIIFPLDRDVPQNN